MFKANIDLPDLKDLDHSVDHWARSGLADDRVALMVVSSLPNELQRLLYQRIEDRKQTLPAIVPIQQTEIETAAEPLVTLRGILDRWLYRRDLFAGNAPVVGRRFFGRDKPLAELRDAIATSRASAVFGLRKVGKTSLLKEMQRRSSEAGDLVLYVDLLRVPSDVTDARWLYWKISSELRRETEKLPLPTISWRLAGRFQDFLEIPSDLPVATAFDSDLTRLLSILPSLGSVPVRRCFSCSMRSSAYYLLHSVSRALRASLTSSVTSGVSRRKILTSL